MSKLIKKVSTNFTVVNNDIVKNKEISNGAKGLYLFLLSLPDEWDFKIRGLASLTKDGETAISNQLYELESWSLVKRDVTRSKKGHFDVNYIICDDPCFIENYSRVNTKNKDWNEEYPQTGFPVVENPVQENPIQENPSYYINKDLNNKDLNNKENTISENKFSQTLEVQEKNKSISLIIEKFKKINPSLNYNNTTQRKACESLINYFKEDNEKLLKIVDYAVSVLGKEYAPEITSPLILQKKLPNLIAFYKKEESKKSKNNSSWSTI